MAQVYRIDQPGTIVLSRILLSAYIMAVTLANYRIAALVAEYATCGLPMYGRLVILSIVTTTPTVSCFL